MNASEITFSSATTTASTAAQAPSSNSSDSTVNASASPEPSIDSPLALGDPNATEGHPQASTRGTGVRSAGIVGRGAVKTDSASLLEAAKKGDAGTIRRALEADPAVASRLDENGMALLHWVAAIGDTTIAAVLLEKGAAIGVKKADDGWTPLALAALAGKLEMVEFLRSRGAVVTTSVLGAAKENGSADILAALKPPRSVGKPGKPPKTADELVREGTAAGERQDWSSAIKSMQAALQADPKSGKAHCGLALAYAATFDMAKAKEHYLQLKKVDPALAARFEASPAGVMVTRGGNIIAI